MIFNCEGKAQKTSYDGREFLASLVIRTLHFHYHGYQSTPGGGMEILQVMQCGKKYIYIYNFRIEKLLSTLIIQKLKYR